VGDTALTADETDGRAHFLIVAEFPIEGYRVGLIPAGERVIRVYESVP
jgi:hypothetical protein